MARRKKSLVSSTLFDSAEATIKIHQLKVIEPTLLGERLRRIRSDRKISQRDLTSGLFTSAYLSSVELGKTRPTLETLEKLAERLGEPVDYFLRPSGVGRFKGRGLGEDFDAEQLQQLELKQHLFQGETALLENNLGQAEQEFNEIPNAGFLIYTDQIYYHLLQARLKNRQNRPDLALEFLEQLAGNQEINPILLADSGLSAWFELEAGRTYKAQNQYFTALDHFHKGLNVGTGKTRWRREILLEAGETYQIIGELEKAAEFFQEGLDLFGAAFDFEAAHTLYTEAQEQTGQGNFQQAAFLLGQGRRYALKAGENAYRLDFALKTSRLNYQLKRYGEARNLAELAESVARVNEGQSAESFNNSRFSSLVLLAKSYFQSGETALAQLYLDQAANVFEKNPQIEPLERAAYFEIAALIYSGPSQNQSEKAAGYYEQAIALLEPYMSGDEKAQGVVGPQLADIYYNYSQLLKDLGRVDQTLENLEKAYRLRSR